MVKTREAVRNARGPFMILLVVSVLALAQQRSHDRESSATGAGATQEATP